MSLKKKEDVVDLPFRDFPGYLLRVVSNQSMAELGDLTKRIDLTVVEATALILIQRNEGCPQRFISQSLNIASANLTPMLSRLERKGMINRRPLDGRIWFLGFRNIYKVALWRH